MTHTFKLSRRTARLRAIIVATLAVAACTNTDSTAPTTTESAQSPSFATTSTSVSVSSISVLSGRSYQVGTGLAVGAKQYIDRSYTYATVPSAVQGLTYIQTANDDKNASIGTTSFLTFNVSADAVVYVAHDDRIPRPSWLTSNFQDTGLDLLSSDGLSRLSLFKRTFVAGKVTLGSNTASTVISGSMYVVLVQPAATSSSSSTTTTTTTTGSGIPFGDFHLPSTEFSNSRYTGSLQALWASSGVYTTLNSAKTYGRRIVISLAGNRSYYTNSDGTFNLSLWKQRIDAFKSYDFGSYVTSGTIIGHYLVDEPFCASCWGGQAISVSTMEAMALYSKAYWPTMPTTVRMPPSAMPLQTYQHLDFAWAQWEGPLHWPSYKLTPQQFRDREIAAAQARGLGVVFGLNYLDGGDGTSHVSGTYAIDPNLSDNVYCTSSSCYRYQMSSHEVKQVGSVFAAAAYACALLNWQYNLTFLSRAGMVDSLNYVSGIARNRSGSSCVR